MKSEKQVKKQYDVLLECDKKASTLQEKTFFALQLDVLRWVLNDREEF